LKVTERFCYNDFIITDRHFFVESAPPKLKQNISRIQLKERQHCHSKQLTHKNKNQLEQLLAPLVLDVISENIKNPLQRSLVYFCTVSIFTCQAFSNVS
jgi:hypothetical protein